MANVTVECLNVPGGDEALMARVRQAFIDEGFSSLAEELSGVLDRHYGQYGLSVGVPGYDPQRSDTLADPEGQVLCQVSLDRSDFRTGTESLVVSALCQGEEGRERATGILSRCIDEGTARSGLPEESRQVEKISESLQPLSPNGKLLAEPAMGSVLKCLYDTQFRRLLRSIVTTFGTVPATREALLRAVTVPGRGRPPKKGLTALLEADDLFRESYLIGCPVCGERALTFAARQQAERTLKEVADRLCSVCREGKLAVLEAYGASEFAAKGVQQGLWLESLVHETLASESLLGVTGRMLGAFELDVACVLYGHVLLVECKDAPFGQTDYVNLIVKAQELGADVVGVVTTNPLHENVKRLIEGQTQRWEGEWLVAEGMEDAAEIANTVAGWIQQLREGYLRRLWEEGSLTQEELSYRMWASRRRRR